MKGQGVAGLFVGLLILGGCVAGLEEKPVQEEIQKQEELARQIGDPGTAEKGPPSEWERRLDEAVREEVARGKVSVVRKERELNVYLSDELLFSREKPLEMTAEGEKMMERIGAILREVPDLPVELEAAAAFKPYGEPEEEIAWLNQQLHFQLVKLAEHLEQKIGLPPERVYLSGEAVGEMAKGEEFRIRIVLIPTIG